MRIGVLVSGGGSNLQSLIDKAEAGVLAADIKVVISNKENAYGLTRARSHGIPAVALSHASYAAREDFDADMVKILKDHGCEAVVLAGFMRFVTPVFLGAFPERVLNIHPALLPSFPGVHGPRDAANYGVRLAGCTVHFVDEKIDHGPIVIQAAAPALPDDDESTLGARILRLEHRVLPQAVHWLATGRLAIDGRQVRLAPADVPPAAVDPDGKSMVWPPLERGF